MSQEAVMIFLKQNPNCWFSVKQIQAELGTAMSSTTKCITKLREVGFILWKYDPEKKRQVMVYKYKKGD